MRSEIADRIVPPVVAQAALDQFVVVHELVHGQQLDCRHAKRVKVLDHCRRGEAGIGSPQLRRHVWVARRETLHVQLVDDRAMPGRLGRSVVSPIEVRADDDVLRHRSAAVRLRCAQVVARLVAEHRAVPLHVPVDGLAVRVEQQLVGVAAQSLRGPPGAVHPEAIPLAGYDAWHVPVVDVGGLLRQQDAPLTPRVIEQAQLDALRDLGEEREVGPCAVESGPERIGPARLDHAAGSMPAPRSIRVTLMARVPRSLRVLKEKSRCGHPGSWTLAGTGARLARRARRPRRFP